VNDNGGEEFLFSRGKKKERKNPEPEGIFPGLVVHRSKKTRFMTGRGGGKREISIGKGKRGS